MFVERYMTRSPITIQADASIMEALQTLRKRKVRKLPVMDGEKLVGIVTSKDLKEGAPSEATSLDQYELNYLLSKTKVREIMTKDPITIKPAELIERAAMLMHEHRFESLPVVDDAGALVGIITESDLFRYMIDLSGIKDGGTVFDLELPDTSGSIQDVADVMRRYGAKIRSILVSYEGAPAGTRHVMIRVVDGDVEAMAKDLRAQFKLLSTAR